MHSARQCQAQRVITEYQAVEFEDLGLGRGVDATNPKPWVNKGDFQVRRVVNYDIIGTEEGNLYEGFVNKVESIQNFQSSLSASVPVDKLVSLGIDSELSRIHSVGRISIGRKVLTRTISFQANFTQSSDEDNFESCLSNWIVQQRKVKQEEKEFLGKQGDPDIKTEPDERKVKIKAKEKEEEVGAKECFDLCYDFVSNFSVTHYVHSFELGASYYRAMSLEEYSLNFSSKAKLGVNKMADIAIGNEISSKSSEYKSQVTRIGRINMKLLNDEESVMNNGEQIDGPGNHNYNRDEELVRRRIQELVTRRTPDEAVISVKLQPISSLVSNVKLRIQLQKALQGYIQDKSNDKCKHHTGNIQTLAKMH